MYRVSAFETLPIGVRAKDGKRRASLFRTLAHHISLGLRPEGHGAKEGADRCDDRVGIVLVRCA